MPTQKKKILVVCSVYENLKMLSSILAGEGRTIIKAMSKEKALESARNDCPDIAVMDFDLSDFGGGDLASAIRDMRSENPMPIVFITSLISEAEERCRMIDGPICFLSKPLDVKRLKEEINSLLNL
jgi:CheY-like chemotaxis protein